MRIRLGIERLGDGLRLKTYPNPNPNPNPNWLKAKDDILVSKVKDDRVHQKKLVADKKRELEIIKAETKRKQQKNAREAVKVPTALSGTHIRG